MTVIADQIHVSMFSSGLYAEENPLIALSFWQWQPTGALLLIRELIVAKALKTMRSAEMCEKTDTRVVSRLQTWRMHQRSLSHERAGMVQEC